MLASSATFSSRAFLRLIEGDGLIGTWGWTFATNEHVWSLGLWHLLGLEPGLAPPTYRLFLDFVHPDDRFGIETEAEIVQGYIQQDRTFRIIRPDGTVRTLSSCNELYFAATGRPRALAGMVIDITDQVALARVQTAQRQRKRALFDEHRIISFAISEHRDFEFPQEASDLTGYSVADILADPFIACAVEEREHWSGHTMERMQQGIAHHATPLLQMADGTRRRFSISVAPVRNAAGAITEWSGIQRPVEISGRVASDTMREGLEQAVEGRHLRAGRALLDWSMTDLAKAGGLSLSTICRLEDDAEALAARSRHRAVAALRAAGIRFTFTDAGTVALTLV